MKPMLIEMMQIDIWRLEEYAFKRLGNKYTSSFDQVRLLLNAIEVDLKQKETSHVD